MAMSLCITNTGSYQPSQTIIIPDFAKRG